MAEDLLGGVLGGEDEKPEIEASQAAAGAEAFAAAVAARLSANDPEVARDTSAFLKEQTLLLATQRQHLEDEHALRLEHLTHQRHLLRGQRLGQAIRIAFQIGIALVVLVLGAGIAVMLHDAFTSHSVVIDSFDAPAALASRGVTGTVLASDVLNELTQLQSATRSIEFVDQKRKLSNGWSNDVKVDVPETGVSLGEISRLLTARFGHDLHIGGGLIETGSGGLALTVSGDSVLPRTFTSASGDLDTLVIDAAQYVYSQFQPVFWARYLQLAGHCPEAIAFIKSAYAGVTSQDHAALLNVWGGCLLRTDSSPGALRSALGLYRDAIKADPDYAAPHVNEAARLARSGDEESAWRAMKGSDVPASIKRVPAPAMLTNDFGTMLDTLIRDAAATAGLGSFGQSTAPDMALLDVRLHDPAAAELTLQTVTASDDPLDVAALHFVRAELAHELGDATQAATEVDAYDAALTDPAKRAFNAGTFSLLAGVDNNSCQIALIEEAAGHPDKADAILANPADAHFVDCQRFRGDILDHRGDWAGAQQAYAQSVALAPDLPAGYYSWGVALARHGDLVGAIAKLEAANQRGPHWADPLKAWGDVLVKQGHIKQALEEYDEALRYAPNWTALKQARAAAASKR
ncbi:MAG: tetratricopeptide repeat protein [Steroidobacteraceae bacterium]